jgi:hypothetical protein
MTNTETDIQHFSYETPRTAVMTIDELSAGVVKYQGRTDAKSEDLHALYTTALHERAELLFALEQAIAAVDAAARHFIPNTTYCRVLR